MSRSSSSSVERRKRRPTRRRGCAAKPGRRRAGWLDLRSALEGGDVRVLLAECSRNEDVTKANYEAALRQELPDPVRSILLRQYVAVKEAQAELERLRGH